MSLAAGWSWKSGWRVNGTEPGPEPGLAPWQWVIAGLTWVCVEREGRKMGFRGGALGLKAESTEDSDGRLWNVGPVSRVRGHAGSTGADIMLSAGTLVRVPARAWAELPQKLGELTLW